MKSIIRLICIIAFFQAGSLTAAVPLPDSTVTGGSAEALEMPEYRYPDPDRISEFKQDEDYNYLNQASPGQSLWDRFWAYVNRVLAFLFRSDETNFLSLFLRFVIYGIAILAIGFAIYKLVMIRYSGVTSGDDSDQIEVRITEENIHVLDFDGLIREALENHNWRHAIRLRYLQTLKLLSDHDMIDWEPYKTNHEYSYEIVSQSLRDHFDRISYYFDYAWYGEFDVEKYHYDRVGAIYDNLKQGI